MDMDFEQREYRPGGMYWMIFPWPLRSQLWYLLTKMCLSAQLQSSKLAGSLKSEASEIMLRTSETILALVRLD